MNGLNYTRIVTLSLLTFSLSGCLNGGSGGTDTTNSMSQSESPLSGFSLKMSGVSQGNQSSNITQVFVNVKELEVLVAGSQKAAKLVIKNNVGLVDLMQFNQGVLLDLAGMQISAGAQIKEVRLRLEESGNYMMDEAGIRCDLQTPSAQQSGLKIKFPEGLRLESGYAYNFVLNFDPNKSIVQQGNGGCLLKPVLRLSSANRVVVDDPSEPEEPVDVGNNDDGGSTPNPEDPPAEEDPVNPQTPVEGVDYIIVDENTILIPQGDGSYLTIEGVDLNTISIQEILNSLQP